MTPSTGPTIRTLSDEESRGLLARQQVGRLAFTLHDRVDIEPIHFVFDTDWVFGRTSSGTKLSTLLHNPWCAFETDDVTDLFNWESVVVKGTFTLLDVEIGSPDTYRRAELALKRLVPDTFTARDPAPHRDVVYGIYAHEISGRASSAV